MSEIEKQETDEGLAESVLMKLLSNLSPFIEVIYSREESFLKKFAGRTAFDLIEVVFGSSHLRFTYILESGQHITDSITIDDLADWLYR